MIEEFENEFEQDNDESVYLKFGRLIRKLRKKAKLTQIQLSEKSGISQAEISKFENRGEEIRSADRIDALLRCMGYELGIVEKKKPLHSLTAKERLQQLLKAAEDVVARMNADAKIDFTDLRAPASGQTQCDDDQGQEA